MADNRCIGVDTWADVGGGVNYVELSDKVGQDVVPGKDSRTQIDSGRPNQVNQEANRHATKDQNQKGQVLVSIEMGKHDQGEGDIEKP